MDKHTRILVLVTAAGCIASRAEIPDLLAAYTATPAATTFIQVASDKDKVAVAQDLDFDQQGNLWVINRGTATSGGSTIKISNPGKPTQKTLLQKDGNAMHFMLQPTALAFGDNGYFATSSGALDANHGSNVASSFTGPTLWNSDPAIYCMPNGGNGSHIDMLHESPYNMGIAHEKGNAFWAFDANSHDVLRYDFQKPHEPGGDDHSDAIIHRYPEVAVKWINQNIPCHLVVQKPKGWLYIVDGGNKRILRLNIASGTVGGKPKWHMTEDVAEYLNVTGATWEVVMDKGLLEPTGVDVLNNTLVVSDHSDGSLMFFDIATMPAREIGRLETGAKGIMGLVIGPDGRIWYVDATTNQVMVAQPGVSTWLGRPLSPSATPFAVPFAQGRWFDARGRAAAVGTHPYALVFPAR